MFEVLGFYKFIKIKSLKKNKVLLQDFLINKKIRGTIIIANEGINGSISGKLKDIKSTINRLKKMFSFNEFDNSNKSIALQIVSGREGISLKKASAIIYYNIDFSATSYWQSRDRMTTKDRETNNIFWVFTKTGIEKEIYKTVINKKDYTLKHFQRDLLSL